MKPTQRWSDVENQTTAFCMQCGASLEPGNAYCTMCGAPVNIAEQPETNPTAFCTNCGKPLEPGNAFCIYCGQKIDSSLPEESPVTPLGHEVTVCPHCQQPLLPGDTFCVNCGAKVDGGSEPSILIPPHSIDDYGIPDDEQKPPEGGTITVTTTPPVNPPGSVLSQKDNNGSIIDDDPLMLTLMVEISDAEARMGCRKTIQTDDGATVEIDVPKNTNPGTKVIVPGYGLNDSVTGTRGPLSVSFFIIRSQDS